MGQYFLKQMNDCIDDFYKLYNRDEYISKKKYEQFIDHYKDVFNLIYKYEDRNDEIYKKVVMIAQYGYEMIDKKNDKFVQKHLLEDKEYFDELFQNIDSNIILDGEQRKAILTDEDYSLIIAGAGSGKTTTMVAKVKYLIEKKHVNPKSIILISFTNKATEELNDMLNNKFGLNVEVLTFHKLGMKFIRNILDAKPEIVSEGGVYKILSDYFLDEVFCNKEKLKQYLTYFSKYLYFDDRVLEFNSYDEYYEYYMDLKYEMCKDNLKREIDNRIFNRLKHLKTINGEYVDSEGEVKIANYLYKNNISYVPGKIFPYKLANGRSYKPDFTIDNIGEEIYVEYYGLAELKEDNSIESENIKYKTTIPLKRETHKKYHTNYIELFGKYENGDYYLPMLSYELSKRNVIKKKRSEKEIFYRLLETSKDAPYFNLIHFFSTFISLFKELGYSKSDFSKLCTQTDHEDIKNQLYLLEDVYRYYQNKLHTRVDDCIKIDFQDMIHYAYSRMDKMKEKQFINYDYVIIDEYQDISIQRYNFMKKISDLFQAKIVAVGDDWQTIYSFSGSDIELFTKFYESMGYAEIITISKTYRNSQQLIDLASDFISRNSFQVNKKLFSDKRLNKPVELIPYNYHKDYDNLPEVLNKLINTIYKNNSKDKILLLSRFNSELDNLLNSRYFYKPLKGEDKIICKSCPNAFIDFLTVHKSKGLGYDQVILLNGLNIYKGFPSQIRDEPVIKLLKSKNAMEESYIEYPEERRLFYVAMTRTKNKLYIMTPTSLEYKSDFIKEIEEHNSVRVSNL